MWYIWVLEWGMWYGKSLLSIVFRNQRLEYTFMKNVKWESQGSLVSEAWPIININFKEATLPDVCIINAVISVNFH